MSKKTQLLLPRMSQSGPFTVEASGYEHVKGETIPRRHPAAKDKLNATPSEDVTTIFDILKWSADRFGNAKALGSRKLVKTHHETKKVKKTVDGKTEEVNKAWSFFELSGYNYISFSEYERLALQIGAGLRKLGMMRSERLQLFAGTRQDPVFSLRRMEMVANRALHSAHWLAMSHGAVSQSMPIATAYDTLGEEGLKHSLVQTKAKAIFCDPHLLKTLVNPLKEAKDIKFVIYNSDGEVKEENINKLKSTYDYLTILSFEELRQLGKNNPVDAVPPAADDLCCIMYTSGSTGAPKGVLIKHSAVVAAIAGVTTIIGQYIGPGDKLLTYLPQAHILEFVFENACLYWGGTMGYGSPKTLSDASVRNCKGDIREFKPTILVGVPAVWESVKKGIIAKVNQSGILVKNLFWSALAAKSFLMSTGLPGTAILDSVVFKKIKDATGGQLRICMNGGGPIAKDTQRFISLAITPMLSGYGLTETTAMGALMDPIHWTDNALGDIPSCVEIKLVDFSDAGYFASNIPPQGEVWIRGPSVFQGYFENEKETEEALTDDGWFKTGDIGEFDKNGHLRMIDRKKNLVKTLNGEYIALEKLESIYRSATVVANICVYAAGDKTKPVAIIVPAEPALKKLAEENGIEGNGIEDLVHSKKLNSIVLKEMQAAGRGGGLTGPEIIDGVVMSDEEWNSANGLTTAAQKINRRALLSKYQKEIDKAYAGGN
ncbi:MAG: long-chain fatty acid-CoA ligase [Alectoria fallacina]|uniref:Long-chain fatty acid-CoA ligase n=1 Tax=Alectoria fallacina TaxID=1903189 RepID=A0A8H3HW04_9LECA|nr:MAG: long-chain fatty acid-CoA ligase [Alectoria fallacina]